MSEFSPSAFPEDNQQVTPGQLTTRATEQFVFDQDNSEISGYSLPPEGLQNYETGSLSVLNYQHSDSIVNREKLSSDNPKVLIIGGAGVRKSTLKDTVKALKDEGIDPFVLKSIYKPARKTGQEGQKRYQDLKVEQGIAEVDSLTGNDEKITLLGHSLGGPVALRIAEARPDKVNRVLLFNSEGLNTPPKVVKSPETNSLITVEADPEKIPFIRLAGRFIVELSLRKNLTFSRQGVRQTLTGLVDLAAHPVSFVGNAKDGARTNAMPIIANLRQKGIEVHNVSGNADMVYPESRTSQAISERSTKDDLAVTSSSSYYATKPSLGSNKMPSRWMYRSPKTAKEKEQYMIDMQGVRTRRHNLASKYAGHDQPIIYPKYVAKIVRQIIRPNEIDSPSQDQFTLAQRAAATVKGGMLDAKEKFQETFVRTDKARRNRLIVAGVGVVAAGAALLAAKKFNIDMPFDFDGSNNGGENGVKGSDTSPTTTNTTTSPGPEVNPKLRGDISSKLNLPDGYINKTSSGYEVTAMSGNNTDSIWRASEHALADFLGQQPAEVQIDALKDILGDHQLDVGDKVIVGVDQIDRALDVAKRSTV